MDGQIAPSEMVTVVGKIVETGEVQGKLSEVVDMIEDDLEGVQLVGLVEGKVVRS